MTVTIPPEHVEQVFCLLTVFSDLHYSSTTAILLFHVFVSEPDATPPAPPVAVGLLHLLASQGFQPG